MPTIEQNIERIADALEALVKLASNPITTQVTNVVAEDPTKVKAEASKAAAGKEKDKTTKPAPKQEAPKPEEPKPDPEPEQPEVDPLEETDAKPPTVDEVRAALKAYRDIEGAAAMMDILKQHGAETLTALKPENYAAVIAAVK